MIGFVQHCCMKGDDCTQKCAEPSGRQAAREHHLTSEKQSLRASTVVWKFIFFLLF